MPLYVFRCRLCTGQWEVLLKAGETPDFCPVCMSETAVLDKLLSTFSVRSGTDSNESVTPPAGFAKSSTKARKSKTCQGHHDTCGEAYIESLVRRYEKSKGM